MGAMHINHVIDTKVTFIENNCSYGDEKKISLFQDQHINENNRINSDLQLDSFTLDNTHDNGYMCKCIQDE